MATPTSLKPNQRSFVKVFQTLCHARSAWQVWNDFVETFAISISNSIIQDPDREQRYLDIITRYGEEDRMRFPELCSILIQALERNPEQDYLGEMFMVLELGSNWHGQFFTPYAVCRMMADMTVYRRDEKWVTVYDPACGAGATMIAARNLLQEQGRGSLDAFFVGQDISRIAGMMCYIQLSLLGCAGYICIADTLQNPSVGGLDPIRKEGQEYWYTPLWYHDLWQVRAMKERYDEIRRLDRSARA